MRSSVAVIVLALSLWLPAAAGAADCLSCHEQATARNPDSPHFKAPVSCESCHGDGVRHAETGDPKLIRSFKGNPAAETCVTCHDDQHVKEWKTSRHRQVAVDCADCHAVHGVKDAKAACSSCH
jgi:hypothetical protein